MRRGFRQPQGKCPDFVLNFVQPGFQHIQPALQSHHTEWHEQERERVEQSRHEKDERDPPGEPVRQGEQERHGLTLAFLAEALPADGWISRPIHAKPQLAYQVAHVQVSMLLPIPARVMTRSELCAAPDHDMARWDDDFRAGYAHLRQRLLCLAHGRDGRHAPLPLPDGSARSGPPATLQVRSGPVGEGGHSAGTACVRQGEDGVLSQGVLAPGLTPYFARSLRGPIAPDEASWNPQHLVDALQARGVRISKFYNSPLPSFLAGCIGAVIAAGMHRAEGAIAEALNGLGINNWRRPA